MNEFIILVREYLSTSSDVVIWLVLWYVWRAEKRYLVMRMEIDCLVYNVNQLKKGGAPHG